MARCGWCDQPGINPKRPADDPSKHYAPWGTPCRGYATWLNKPAPKLPQRG